MVHFAVDVCIIEDLNWRFQIICQVASWVVQSIETHQTITFRLRSKWNAVMKIIYCPDVLWLICCVCDINAISVLCETTYKMLLIILKLS